jgi:two-component system, LytTR family, response regulator
MVLNFPNSIPNLTFHTRHIMKAVIVEDEQKGLINLQNLLEKYCEEIDVIATAGSVATAIEMFKNPALQPDVAFLDISLPDGLVFQALNALSEINFEVIFVTAYKDFAIKACQYSSIGYVLKPIDPDELKSAVSRIKSTKLNKMSGRLDVFNQQYNSPNAFGKMSVSAVDGIYFINIKDIIRLEAEDNYTHIFLKGQKMTVAKTLKNYEELLSTVNFFRVHKGHLINLNFMNRFMRNESEVVMEDGASISVSKRRRSAFLELLKRLQIEIKEGN